LAKAGEARLLEADAGEQPERTDDVEKQARGVQGHRVTGGTWVSSRHVISRRQLAPGVGTIRASPRA
jgi:hypothetical protein